jgi:hypothetical protein
MQFVELKMKFQGMRKESEFTVYPMKENDNFMIIQSDNRIGKILLNEYKILLSKAGQKYFIHLSEISGSKWINLSNEQMKLIQDARNKILNITNQNDRTIRIM